MDRNYLIRSQSIILNLLIYILISLVLIPLSAYSQGKQANYWYFGYHVGLNFNTGSPPPTVLSDGKTYNDTPQFNGTASISDSDGNLLFYTDGVTIWNKTHGQMLNGSDMGMYSTQGAMIVPDPVNVNLYYFFNFVIDQATYAQMNFQYSIIDMSLDGGLGGVVPDKKSILLVENTTTHLSAVFHKNCEDIWVVTHGMDNNTFYSFLITSGGISIPQTSNAGTKCDSSVGYLKISPNGKKIALAQFSSLTYIAFFDLLDFDNDNGIVSDGQLVHNLISSVGLEFSPDNTKLYSNGGEHYLYQFDLTAGTPEQIIQSQVELTTEYLFPGALQLGPDGKIYCATDYQFIGIIHNPNASGLACNFEREAIAVADGTQVFAGLPSFIQSYLNDPEFSTTGHCFGSATQFTITSTNGIDSVFWDFKDLGNAPNDTSRQFNPAYTFSAPGTHYPELTVWSGLLPPKTVKDTVVIYALPSPDLGNDTSFCANTPIDLPLYAGPGTSYSWNGAFPPTTEPTYQVTSTGTYFVKVFDHGCSASDTIEVGRYTEPLIQNTTPTTSAHCGASDGAITGISVITTYTYDVVWVDGSGNVVGNSLDLLGVPSGAYTLTIGYGTNCSSEFGPFTIDDIGAPGILSAVPTEDHCNLGLGTLTITPPTGNPTDYSYSINGGPFLQNGGVFTGLSAQNYTVMIKDQFDCTGSYQNNPVALQNIPGPEYTNIILIPETAGNGQGSITVYANGINLTYALNGVTQAGNTFGNLSQGYYTIQIEDVYGCTANSVVYIDDLQGNYLLAMAGGDTLCLNAPANSLIRVSHVNGVKDLTATLTYDGTRLNCLFFNDSLPGITGMLYPALSKIVLQWHGLAPITSNDTITLGELIFETLQSGIADVNWQSPPGSVFTDENGDTIHPEFVPGIIQVHQVPAVSLSAPTTLCQGESLQLVPQITGGTDPVSWQWNTPQGINTASNIQIENALPEHSGRYSFKVSDYFHCIDTTSVIISIIPTPTANFPQVNDTIWYEKEYRLEATPNYYSYQWSTGDTTYFINVTEEGNYSVTIQTKEGCENLESVMMMDSYVPIAVPNAFSPNGDGLNDTFKPVVNMELVKQFSMSIYNKWGQRIFETTSTSQGWQGKDAQPGVYSWVINYSNRVGKMFKMKGVVVLVR